jgi:hypothetical protein
MCTAGQEENNDVRRLDSSDSACSHVIVDGNRCLKVSVEADDPVDWERHSRQVQATSGKVDVELVVLSLKSTLGGESLQGSRVPLQARGSGGGAAGRMKPEGFLSLVDLDSSRTGLQFHHGGTWIRKKIPN